MAGQRPVAGRERLSPSDLALERLMLGLRTASGIDLTEIDQAYGTTIAATNEAVVEDLQRQGKIEIADGRLRPTLAGLATADSVALAFEILGAS